MRNKEVAKLLRNIAKLLEIKQENVFKIRAYERAALIVEDLEEDIEDVAKEGTLQELPGIGEAISEKISEFLKTGISKYYEELKKSVPINMEELGRVRGLGPKTLLKLHQKLNISDFASLEKAALEGKIGKIKGLGPKVEQNILYNLGLARKLKHRYLLPIALNIATEIKEDMISSKLVGKIEIVGSLRRMKETIGDIDLLITTKKPIETIDYFSKLKKIDKIIAKGDAKCSVLLKDGMQADLRVFDEKNYGAGLIYFTGSKQHNIDLRTIAVQKKMKLSEYGLFELATDKLLAGKSEQEIYQKLGMQFIPAEIREGEGEITAAKNNALPKLIEYSDLKGDLQMHTSWSDGTASVMEMAVAAQKLGHEYICITDHIGNMKITNALDEKRILAQKKEISEANKKLKGKITILHGGEVNILNSGELDIKDSILKEMDIVLGAIHSGFNNPKEKMTQRIIRAMENPHVDIIAHPTGRLLNKREPYNVDFDAILEVAKKTGTILEINALPHRLDLDGTLVHACIKKGIKLSIGTDSHDTTGLKNYIFGIAMARRGWATKEDVVNTLGLKGLLENVNVGIPPSL